MQEIEAEMEIVMSEVCQEHPEAQGRRQLSGQHRSMTPQGDAGERDGKIRDVIYVYGRLIGSVRVWDCLFV